MAKNDKGNIVTCSGPCIRRLVLNEQNFYADKQNKKTGFSKQCKDCRNEVLRKWKEKKRENKHRSHECSYWMNGDDEIFL